MGYFASVSEFMSRAGSRRRGLPGVARGWRSTIRLTKRCVIELVLGCRLGVGVEVTRPGIGQVPERRAPGRCDTRRRRGFAEVGENVAHSRAVDDEGDDAHVAAAAETPERENLVEAGERQRPSVTGGANGRSREISAATPTGRFWLRIQPVIHRMQDVISYEAPHWWPFKDTQRRPWPTP